jgi:gluconolactonase
MPARLSPAIVISVFAFTMIQSQGQNLGTVSLPPDIASPGAKVAGALNRNPADKSFLTYSEGPAVDAGGTLYFSECGGDLKTGYPNRIWKVTPAGKASIFYSADNGSNGMEFDSHGNLVVCLKDTIASFSPSGKRTILASSGGGVSLKRTNDLTIGSDGSMYFTNHATGNEVFRRGASGAVTRFPGFAVPNGIEWIEEERILYVTLSTDTGGKVVKYDVKDDGTLANPRDFAPVPVPDGITADEKGDVYVASWAEGAVHVFDKAGKPLGKITVKSANPADGRGGNASNCVFGGPDRKTLYITGNGGCYKVPLLVAGRRRPAAHH